MKVKHKKRSHKESSPEFSDESPRKHHKKHKETHRKEHSQHRDDYSKKHKRSRQKDGNISDESPTRKNSHARKRDERDRRRSRERSSSPVRIKKEEDFDKRQEELRRKRRRENATREERRPHHDKEIQIKREPAEEDNRHRQRNERRQRGDIEQERRQNDARRAEAWQKRESQGGQNAEALVAEGEDEPKEKEKPNLGLSGALTEDTNTFRGVVIKYNEPPEARVPKKKWRLYPFKGDEALKVLHLHRQSAYLLGKMRRIVDIPIDHPSCSKQHAVFQFRMVERVKDDGTTGRTIKPYIIDLDSSNGTFVNNQKIQPRRYVELKEKDVVKFAYSSREYVLIHDKSDTTEVNGSSSEEEEED
ncbi:smad nuclear interacting protein 1-like [Styela clava]